MYFFNDSISIITISFGSLFSDIEVQRNDNGNLKIVKVPFFYAGKSHWYQKQFKNLVDKENISKILPQISFQLTNLQYDPDRQTNKFERIRINQIESSAIHKFAKKWIQTRLPYIFTFTVSIQTKLFSDMNQIIEQILPYFPAGSRNLHVKEIPILNVYNTAKVTMSGQNPDIQVDFDERTDRIVQYELTFDVFSYLYPPYKTDEVIEEIDLKIYMMLLNNDYENIDKVAEYILDSTGITEITENSDV